LAVVLLAIPPLRERTEDIALLAEHFLREAGLEGPIEDLIGEAAMRSLAAHHWPGNVRELRNLLEATVAMGESQIASLQSAAPSPPAVGAQGFGPLLDQSYKEARAALLHAFESAYLDKLMTGASGNVSKAARQAKMDRSYLIDLLHRHGKQS
jgi:DNA-binding NtrC family response regulator